MAEETPSDLVASIFGTPDPGAPNAETSASEASAAEAAAEAAADNADSGRTRDLGELQELIEKGSLDGIRRWLESGEIAIDDRDGDGRTPLMLAAAHGEPEPVRLLVDAGARPDLTDGTPSGCSALVYAVRSSSPRRNETVSVLAAAGADVNQACGRNRRTPLMHAAETDVYLETDSQLGFALTTKILISLGANLELKDRRGRTVWRLTKLNALGARTSSAYRRRLHQMLRVLEHAGAKPIASHLV